METLSIIAPQNRIFTNLQNNMVMEAKTIVKIEGKECYNPLYGKIKNSVCITETKVIEKHGIEMPDFSSVELTFSVKEEKYTMNANAEAFGLTSVERTFVLFFVDTHHRVFEFEVNEDKTYSLKVYLNQGDFEDGTDDYVVPGDLKVVFT